MGIQSIEIGGPQNPEASHHPKARASCFVCRERTPGCLRRIVENLARRAYRRPVTRTEVAQLMAHADRARKRGDSFDEQIVIAVQAVLVSPSFLFRIERDQHRGPAASVPDAYYLNDYELASRLSTFSGRACPTRVDRGCGCRQPASARGAGRQVKRMLTDSKIERLIENFGGQWLQFRALESHRPDFYKFPLWDNYLRLSAEQETRLFFANVIREDRSVLDFLDADYSFVNEYLAQFYGIGGVTGPEFRRVSLRARRAVACWGRRACSRRRRTPIAPRWCCAANGFSRIC